MRETVDATFSEPVSSIGVPTQTTMRSTPSVGMSALGMIRSAACWTAYAWAWAFELTVLYAARWSPFDAASTRL